jgi:hypothetical protein
MGDIETDLRLPYDKDSSSSIVVVVVVVVVVVTPWS